MSALRVCPLQRFAQVDVVSGVRRAAVVALVPLDFLPYLPFSCFYLLCSGRYPS